MVGRQLAHLALRAHGAVDLILLLPVVGAQQQVVALRYSQAVVGYGALPPRKMICLAHSPRSRVMEVIVLGESQMRRLVVII